MNVFAATVAWTLSLAWMWVRVQERDRRHLVEWTTDLRHLNAEEFEYLVGEVYRREGWDVEHTGKHDRPDGNVDLRLRRRGEHAIVQCKAWGRRRFVKIDEIRKFGGTLLGEGRGSIGIYVTLSDFHEQARAEAAKTGIVLVAGLELYARIEKVRRAEPCPQCQTPMLFGRSLERGWWLRCPRYPACNGKVDLGEDVGRAVALLVAPV